MSVPYWVQDAIFYQIFPDRFANGDPSNDPPNVQPWGSPPTVWGFQGGDLRGIVQRFDYLLDLGVNAIYLNPIFQATSNHRYNTTDYYRIDPKLGNMADFRSLVEVCHRNNIRLILDGVFNHCGRGFFAFNDVLENQEHSPYRDWFHLNGFPVDAYSPGNAKDYLGWWKLKSLPKFDTKNPAVRQYLLGVARYWIEQGADGWRLDVPNEIDDDQFWAEFRHVVKSVNPEAYLVGEIWEADPRWVGEGHFDGLLHYPLREALLDCVLAGGQNVEDFASGVKQFLSIYARENVYAMYLPLGSHDTERVLTLLGDVTKVKLAFAFIFAFPGAPAIFYGDEIGLQGDKDPDCRQAFPWDAAQWNMDLRDYVQRLIDLRKRFSTLRRGEYRPISADNQRGCLIFARILGRETVVIALNFSSAHQHIHFPVGDLGWEDGWAVRDLLDGHAYHVSGGSVQLAIPPQRAVWLIAGREETSEIVGE